MATYRTHSRLAKSLKAIETELENGFNENRASELLDEYEKSAEYWDLRRRRNTARALLIRASLDILQEVAPNCVATTLLKLWDTPYLSSLSRIWIKNFCLNLQLHMGGDTLLPFAERQLLSEDGRTLPQ